EHGLFCALYTDRGHHYFHTPAAGEPVDKERLTQVGRASAVREFHQILMVVSDKKFDHSLHSRKYVLRDVACHCCASDTARRIKLGAVAWHPIGCWSGSLGKNGAKLHQEPLVGLNEVEHEDYEVRFAFLLGPERHIYGPSTRRTSTHFEDGHAPVSFFGR